jgi:glycolate oxidase
MLPDAVARPRDREEICELIAQCAAERTTVTAAGGQTSMTAASITDRGVLLHLGGLDRVLEVDPVAGFVRVEAGARLGEVKRRLAGEGLLLAPDPTSEDDATIGGAIACNASGARTLRYGATRSHVRALTVVLANGELAEFRRPSLEKNTVGYALAQDAVDWFVGSEGTLGVIVDAELSLLPLPQSVTGLAVPFADEHDAFRMVIAARESKLLRPRCIELFDEAALQLAAADAEAGAAWRATAMVYVEDDRDDPSAMEDWLALAESMSATTDDIEVFEGEVALREARRRRHLVPSTMNERGARFVSGGGRKVSTDWAVPYRRLEEAVTLARKAAESRGLERPVIYGHAGNGHPHENFLARDGDELVRIEEAVEDTLRGVLGMGGTVAAEHGIGKLKKKWLPLQMSERQRRVMQAVKNELDPDGILAPGNVL